MPVTALSASALIHNKAQNVTASLGVAADTVNFNSAPNMGATIVVIQCGATPGTVAASFSQGVDGVTPADVNILDQAGGALAANTTYVLLLGGVGPYGNPVTLKATQSTTKLAVFHVGIA